MTPAALPPQQAAALLRQGLAPQAAQALALYLQQRPHDAQAWQMLGMARMMAGQLDDAVSALEQSG